jgi:hypothetical protein
VRLAPPRRRTDAKAEMDDAVTDLGDIGPLPTDEP